MQQSTTLAVRGRRTAEIASTLVGGGILLSLGGIALAIALGFAVFAWFCAHPRLVKHLEPGISASLVLVAAGLALLLRLPRAYPCLAR